MSPTCVSLPNHCQGVSSNYKEKCVRVQYCMYQQIYLQCLYIYTSLCNYLKLLDNGPRELEGFLPQKVHFVCFNLCDLLYEQSGLCEITG